MGGKRRTHRAPVKYGGSFNGVNMAQSAGNREQMTDDRGQMAEGSRQKTEGRE